MKSKAITLAWGQEPVDSSALQLGHMMHKMLAQPHWLWPQDFDFVQSVPQQLQKGKTLSARQAKVIAKIYQRFCKNQQPRIFWGGSPGTGKRR